MGPGALEGTPLEGLVHELATITAMGLQIDHLRGTADWCLPNDWPDRLASQARLWPWPWETGPLASRCLHPCQVPTRAWNWTPAPTARPRSPWRAQA
jgi:hypothetical protein